MFRTDRSLILFAPEAVYNTIPSSGWQRFGYHDTANLPDPDYGWTPYYALRSAKRVSIIKGKISYSGSISDISLNSTAIFPFLTQDEDIPLPSIAISAQTFDTDGASPFNRIYTGGRIGRASLSANEGEALNLSIDEMLFTNAFVNRNSVVGERTSFITPTDSTTPLDGDRWVFSGASISFNGLTLTRIRRFTVDIDNGLQPYYGIHSGNFNNVQSPIRILTGQNKYTVTLDVDFVDEEALTLWDYLFNQGSLTANAPMTGVSIIANFTRLDSSLTISVLPVASSIGAVFQKVDFPFNVASSGYYRASFITNVDRLSIV